MSVDNSIGVNRIDVGEKTGNFFELKQLVGVDPDYVIDMSFGLRETIQNLPSGSKVGIEYLPDFTTNKPEEYYSKLIRFCNKNDLKVVPLIDPVTVEEAKKHHTLAADESIGAWERYIHEVMENYLLEVVNQEKMFKLISEEKPDLVILGSVNANILAFDGTQEKYGIWIKEGNNQNESVEVIGRRGRQERCLLSGIANIDRRIYLSRELLVRKYNAITQGRILPAEEPDFIGYWLDEQNVPEKGLFEIYLMDKDKKKRAGIIHGTIVDTLGNARLDGAIDKGEIKFTKAYTERLSLGNAHSQISYSGNRSRGVYKGTYSIKDDPKGEFVLQKFDPQKTILPELKTKF
jgi:hypothetical protein